MNRRNAVLPLVVAALIGVVGCTNSMTGSGIPVSTADTVLPDPTSSGPALASIQPCDLLTSDAVSHNQLDTPTQENLAGARSCTWQQPITMDSAGSAVGVDIRDRQGIKDINTDGYTVTLDNIGSHPGRQLQSTLSGSCIIVIGVTNSSRVDVVVNAGTDPIQGCQLANQFARLVEPNLPAATG